MKKKVRKPRPASKKAAPKKKYKSYYVPVSQRKDKVAKKAKVAKKKYKSYYIKKKDRIKNDPVVTEIFAKAIDKARKNPKKLDSAFIAPINVKDVDASAIDKPVTTSKRPVKYLNNKDLLAQVIASKKQAKMTNELAKMLQLLTLRYGKKGNFANYTYNDDMQSYAMLMICKTWQGFDPAKSSNPFAWFTQCIKNSFIQYLNYEKRQRDIRDEVLVDSGLSPSYNYQAEYASEYHSQGGGGEPNENVTVESSDKPSHNADTFDAEEPEEAATSDTLIY